MNDIFQCARTVKCRICGPFSKDIIGRTGFGSRMIRSILLTVLLGFELGEYRPVESWSFWPSSRTVQTRGCFQMKWRDGYDHPLWLNSVLPVIDTKALEQLFRYKVLKMRLSKSKIT